MNILVVSDLHVDINETFNFGFMKDKTEKDAIIIAGDISGSVETHIQYLNKLKDIVDCPIIAIAGNHLGYDFYRNGCKQEDLLDVSISTLQKESNSNLFFLHNEYVDVGDYIIFGGPMYTDFKLYDNEILGMTCAKEWMNDFRCVHIYDVTTDEVRSILPMDYIKWFEQFKAALKKCIEETTKDIIVVTHFAPSIKSISSKYNSGIYKELNPSYASNMEDFIKENPRIKLWVHGHMHDSFDYKIGQCYIICEPYGYFHEKEYPPIEYHGRVIEMSEK